MFEVLRETPVGRRGVIHTLHGDIQTPCFMPVATAGAMKGLTHGDLLDLGADILLCNTYHLLLQPGVETIESAGGLHAFMNWEKPIITDSGGFQVFSLSSLRSIDDRGVTFRSPANGDEHRLDPESAMRIQHALGSDIIMAFDECPPSTASRSEIETAVDRTLRWAQECKKIHSSYSQPVLSSVEGSSLLFGIVQGGLHRDLRKMCAEELIAIGFDGYAIGGLAVGETPEEMFGVLDDVCPLLPNDKPRYLMGVGELSQLRQSVRRGIDMFDCVLPMRLGRHGTLLLSNGSELRITNAEYQRNHSIIDPDSPSELSRVHRKSYLCHLLRAKERYGETIAVKQNLGVTLKLMKDLQRQMDSVSH